ncbi:hypothetical protein RE428_15560 [Marinobacter nanhaiticus D15-8W]|uniref:Uncharacterized protein n=1 Tax=Marinobacter nanhaiticus D15-8W TaxID=626887 RepID=N6WWJ6_9GAMM|nr:hypothetical protein [Marinobacter nanhaiticus]ENO13178.1 hypothetical protein J057_17320 [Marinobacter nanhaiticus D15-8W]BES70538.1 hypothetical protein RE428_15560 [Marinobacter nanhaiticus D15-8W]
MAGNRTSPTDWPTHELDSQTEEWNREIERLRNQSHEKMAEAQDPQTRQRIEEEFAREIQQRQDNIRKAREQAEAGQSSGNGKSEERK